MKESFNKLFIHEIKDLHSAETQIVQALPLMVKAATDESLKEAFTNHLAETKNQVKRLNRILSKLKQSAPKTKCDGMKGILEEGKKIIKTKFGNNDEAVKDAALIGAAQRVEHYEIAAYGTARAFALLLGFDDIVDLLQESLDEESNANETLNKIAEGGFFSRGINLKATRDRKLPLEVSVTRQKIQSRSSKPKRSVSRTTVRVRSGKQKKSVSRTKVRSR